VKDASDLVSIIILTHNRKERVVQCVQSVLGLDYTPINVIVVDNGSSDGTYEALVTAFSDPEVIRSEDNLGAVSGRNHGLVYAKTRYNPPFILFLDDDTVVEKHMLTYLMQGLQENTKAGIACPKAYQEFPSNSIMSVGLEVNLYTGFIQDIGCGEVDEGQFTGTKVVSACGGFGLLIKTEVLHKLGGWDERFNPYGWEDVDFCLSAKKIGYETLSIGSAVLFHAGGKIGRGPLPTYETYKIRNLFFLLQKHATWLQFFTSCFFAIPIKGAGQIGKLILQGKFNLVLAQLKGMIQVLRKT